MESNCVKCKIANKICRAPEGKGPKNCPTLTMARLFERALDEYDKPAIKDFARQASVQEAECYAYRERKPFVMHPTKPRIVEVMEFAGRMDYRRLGLAFCGGVAHEAEILADILEKNGFDVIAVSCKCGGIPKERIGLKEEEKVRIGEYESMCNPIAQAMVLNEEKTDFNIMLCLCVGHDSLFLKYVEAPTTVFAVKDRVTGHNPMAALYAVNSYYSRLRKPVFGRHEDPKA